MLTGLTLKYDTLDNWTDFLKINSHTPLCQVVGKNGKGKLNPIILVALSPFLKEMLSSLPPYIEGCIILPDIEFSDISVFLGSLSQSNKKITVTQSLVTTLGINLDHFNEVTVRNLVKEKLVSKNVDNNYENHEDYLENDTENEQVQSKSKYSNNQEILEDSFPTFIEDNKEDIIIIDTKSSKKLNVQNEIYVIDHDKENLIIEAKSSKEISVKKEIYELKEEFYTEPEFDANWISNVNGMIASSIKEKFSDQTDSKLNGIVEISSLNENERAAKNKTFKDEKSNEFDMNWMGSNYDVIDLTAKENILDKTGSKLYGTLEISNLTNNERAANNKAMLDDLFSTVIDEKSNDYKHTSSYDFIINKTSEQCNNTDQINEEDLYSNWNENIDDKRTSHSDSLKIFMCSFCPKTFKTGASTIVHENTHNGIIDDNKALEEKSRKRKAKSKKHIILKAFDEIKKTEMVYSTENESIEYIFEKCEFCEKPYATKSKLRTHQLKYHPSKIMSVHTVKAERLKYKTDVQSKHFEKLNGLICCTDGQCSKTFKSMKAVYAHYEGVHIGKLLYPCDICDKIFKSLHVSRLHLSNVHNAQQNGNVICELCGGSYVSKRNMRLHKRTHHPDQPQIFVCSYCPKTFKRKVSIRVHENSHTGAKRVACYVCGKIIYSKEGLEKHIKNRHEKIKSTETSGVKIRKGISNSIGGYKNDLSRVRFEKQGGRFHCKQPKCSQSMKSHQLAIHHHEEVHIGLPLYPCDQCEKVLKSRHGWKVHKFRDHMKGTDTTVKCEYCGKDWISEARRRAHILKYHKEAKNLVAISKND